MTFLPIAINITDKKILVVGGGRVASHKISFLLPYTKNITVVAPEINDSIRHFELDLKEKTFDPGDLNGYFMVYSCTNIKELNQDVKKAANERNMLVSVVDDPPLCDFVSPAIYRSGNMSVAVTSNAQNVRRSIFWRNLIKDFFENGKYTDVQ